MGWASRANKGTRKETGTDSKWGNDTPFFPPPQKYRPQATASAGSNESERLLARLSRDTFLSLWSYPNVYRAERRGDRTFSKEVCDLLVVFEEHVLIFSDKDCVFSDHSNLDVAWARWYRKAVHRSALQLHGAERVIRNQEPLFLDVALQHRFPLPLPDITRMRVHRILVAHGASDRCRKELNGSGSLIINPSIVGDDHLKPMESGGMPFGVGSVVPNQPFVHILDDTSLPMVLRTLDTAADLTRYLTMKEHFISSGQLTLATGEEALLGLYLRDIDETGQHCFTLPPGAPRAIDESWWRNYIQSPEVAAKREADRTSYLWDALIERFAHHFQAGTADYLTSVDTAEHVAILRHFARENRLRRRWLSETLLDMLRTTPPNMRRLRVVRPVEAGDPFWVFLLFPYLRSASNATNRETRRAFLEYCGLVTKLMYPQALDIVAFATDSGDSSSRSEDAMYLDVREWTAEMEADARELQRKYNILTRFDTLHQTAREYPIA